MCCSTTGSCAAGHESDSCMRRYNKCPDLYLYLSWMGGLETLMNRWNFRPKLHVSVTRLVMNAYEWGCTHYQFLKCIYMWILHWLLYVPSSWYIDCLLLIIPTLVIHHSFTLSLRAQNLSFQQILSTVDFFYLLDCLMITGLDRTYHAHHFIFSFAF